MELVVAWLIANWTTIIIPTAVGFGGYFSARRKNKLDLTSQETDVLGEKWRLAITMLDDSTKRFKDTIGMMEEDNSSLRKQNVELVSTLTDKVDRLTKEMRKLERVVKYRSDDKSN
jgi:hypothetical protein